MVSWTATTTSNRKKKKKPNCVFICLHVEPSNIAITLDSDSGSYWRWCLTSTSAGAEALARPVCAFIFIHATYTQHSHECVSIKFGYTRSRYFMLMFYAGHLDAVVNGHTHKNTSSFLCSIEALKRRKNKINIVNDRCWCDASIHQILLLYLLVCFFIRCNIQHGAQRIRFDFMRRADHRNKHSHCSLLFDLHQQWHKKEIKLCLCVCCCWLWLVNLCITNGYFFWFCHRYTRGSQVYSKYTNLNHLHCIHIQCVNKRCKIMFQFSVSHYRVGLFFFSLLLCIDRPGHGYRPYLLHCISNE